MVFNGARCCQFTTPPELLNGVVTTTRGRTLDVNDTLDGVLDPASYDDSSVGPPPLGPRDDESIDDDELVCSFQDSFTDADASVWYNIMKEDKVQDDVEVEWFANCCELCSKIPEGDNVSLLTFAMISFMNWRRGPFFLLWKLIFGGVQELFEPLWKLIAVPSFFVTTLWWDTMDIILVPPPLKTHSRITCNQRHNVAAWEYKHRKDQYWSPSLFYAQSPGSF
jgi:hypothetical protein